MTTISQQDAKRFERMFMAACEDLGAINEALGLDPDDGGAEPILHAIEELKACASRARQSAEPDHSRQNAALDKAKHCIRTLQLAAKTGRNAADFTEVLDALAILLPQVANNGRLTAADAANLDVLAERRRQVEQEGYTPAHDDEHQNDEIAAYAAFYAMPPAARQWPAIETGYGDTLAQAIVPHGWPIPLDGDRRRELVKAGALILAEIERIDRTTANGAGDRND